MLNNVYIYNTSFRRFEKGSICIQDNIISSLSFHDFEGEVKGYVIPGLIDNHMHIESSMIPPGEFSKAVLRWGTTTVVSDCHEITNVFGIEGLKDFMNLPSLIDVFHGLPSSVPSTKVEWETTGGVIGVEEVRELAKDQRVICLGEVMNFPDVVSKEDTLMKDIIKTFKELRPLSPIEGHVPKLTGKNLDAFLASGIGSDHTHQTPESILEKLSKGVFIQLQEKSLTKEIMDLVKGSPFLHQISLVTDDVMPDTLLHQGHLSAVIVKAVSLGLPVEEAIFLSTYTPAMHMGLVDRGVIGPGKRADLVVLKDLESFTVDTVYQGGKKVFQGELLVDLPEIQVEGKYLNSIVREPVTLEELRVKSSRNVEKVRVIEREVESTFTKEILEDVPVKEGLLQWKEAGLNLLVCVNRYEKQGNMAFGFVKNGLNNGAICTSWAHDHHNLLAMGSDEKHLEKAINTVIENQGGIAYCDDEETFFLPLHYAGILSLEPLEVLAEKLAKVRGWMKKQGYKSHNEIMSFAVLGLPVSPVLKLTDKGYIKIGYDKVLSWSLYEDEN